MNRLFNKLMIYIVFKYLISKIFAIKYNLNVKSMKNQDISVCRSEPCRALHVLEKVLLNIVHFCKNETFISVFNINNMCKLNIFFH